MNEIFVSLCIATGYRFFKVTCVPPCTLLHLFSNNGCHYIYQSEGYKDEWHDAYGLVAEQRTLCDFLYLSKTR